MVHHEAYTSISEMHLGEANDGQHLRSWPIADVAAAYPSVNHSWIFHVLEKASARIHLPVFTNDLLCNSITQVQFAGRTRGQFLMARGVRQWCLASGFLLALAFDPLIRWIEDAAIPRNPAGLNLLQSLPCAHADDFAVAASSFRRLIALAPALKVDQTGGLNLNHRKCCWVQYDSESCLSLLGWVDTNCEEFREMKIVRYAKYVGTMIGPEGHIHRWTVPRKNNSSNQKMMHPPRVWWRDCATLRYVPFLNWSILDPYSHRTKQPSRKRPTQCDSHQPITCWLCVRPWTRHTWNPFSQLAAQYGIASNSGTLANGLAKIQAAREYDHAKIHALNSRWKETFLNPSMVHDTVEAYEIVRRLDHMEKLMTLPMARNKRLPRLCSATNPRSRTLPTNVTTCPSRILGPASRFRIAQIMPQMSREPRASRPGLTVGSLTHPLQWSLYSTKISR